MKCKPWCSFPEETRNKRGAKVMNIEDTIFDDGMAINSLVGATRCRIVECTQVLTWSTRHVPAGLYAGVLPSR